jgi:hypothetical protein
VVYKSWKDISLDLSTAAIQDPYSSTNGSSDFVSLRLLPPKIMMALEVSTYYFTDALF